jgi:hypothetical protein
VRLPIGVICRRPERPRIQALRNRCRGAWRRRGSRNSALDQRSSNGLQPGRPQSGFRR